jgi:hypothetical protein
LAYDEQHLYLAVVSPRTTDSDDPADDRPRPHDGDLSRHDRVMLVLDADRDFATGWELTVDSRGWTGDRCWGDAAWNPQWFVAAGSPADDRASRDTAWSVEAAIPWRELAIRAPRAGEAWACAAEREAPEVPRQSWLGPADKPRGPEHFGLLVFE